VYIEKEKEKKKFYIHTEIAKESPAGTCAYVKKRKKRK
jgi:hypothetical protein